MAELVTPSCRPGERGWSAREAFDFVRRQRKIARLRERPLGIPRPQWRALTLFEEAEAMRATLAKQAGGGAEPAGGKKQKKRAGKMATAKVAPA